MIGEKIQSLLISNQEDDFVLLQTDKSLYSLRLGGFKSEKPLESFDDYRIISCPFKGQRIQMIYSDDHWVYYIVEGDGIIASGWNSLSISGEIGLGVSFSSLEYYGNDYFDDDDFFQIIADSNGDSIKAY